MGVVLEVEQLVAEPGLHHETLELQVLLDRSTDALTLRIPITWHGLPDAHGVAHSSGRALR